MNTHLKVFASYNILQYLCDFIHVLIFCNCLKMPKKSQINESSDKVSNQLWVVLCRTVEFKLPSKVKYKEAVEHNVSECIYRMITYHND